MGAIPRLIKETRRIAAMASAPRPARFWLLRIRAAQDTMEDPARSGPRRTRPTLVSSNQADLDRLVRFFADPLGVGHRRQTIGASPPTPQGARRDDRSERINTSRALRASLLQGPGTRGLLDPRAAEAPPPVRPRSQLTIVQEFVDVETAKQAGRAGFGEMLAFLQATPSCRTILVEKTDRLYRNIRDWITVDDLDLTVHFVKENAVVSKASRSSEKFMHGIKVLMAKNYVDNLSEEVKKGLREKAEQGHWPTVARSATSTTAPRIGSKWTRCEAPLIATLFELYATGQYSLKALDHQGARDGTHPPTLRPSHDEGRDPPHPAEPDLHRRLPLARNDVPRLARCRSSRTSTVRSTCRPCCMRSPARSTRNSSTPSWAC